MKIVICGAGLVGSAIASHLSEEHNDVTVVDASQENIQRLTDQVDVHGVVGVASHPDRLAEAGVGDAELLIAVTDSDEINMVACQVSHTIFNTPVKIARIRSQAYLNPLYGDLYAPDDMPIDHIISPEREVSAAVSNQLRVPGAFDVKDMCDGKMSLVGVLLTDDSPIRDVSLRHLTNLFPDLLITVLAIIRDGKVVIPRSGNESMQTGDRVYFVCDATHLHRAMASFGHEEPEARSVVIAGGGSIGQMLAREIGSNFENTAVQIIELHASRARTLAEELQNTGIINGDALDSAILREAGVHNTETFVSVTEDDEVNILSALLAKRTGAKHAVALVNIPGFIPLVGTLGVDAVINPSQITVSSILEHVRRGRIRDVHPVIEDLGEVLEAEALPSSLLVGKSLRLAKIPKGIAVGGVLRDGRVIAARGDTVIESGDTVVIFAARGKITQVEKLLSVRLDIF
ncbi:MAG: Trk system potassium transporter TrkA [SAR116 cluster bacterium]|nr:MAG: Trk system potassium transporter TrkA [SAR116 cluster bacterium]|tara:strand:- start:1808 stop:3187 length:1380 start_codon:yes stop_codon:yes gene_type:complete